MKLRLVCAWLLVAGAMARATYSKQLPTDLRFP
jgi:hypothetical protein